MKHVASQREELTAVVFAHEVIQRNPYTKWFKLGEASTEQVVDLVVQFSVFSNHFIPLEAKRMVNAATEEEEKEARAILGSEIGVSIDATTGNIEGHRFSHNAAHIKWLRDIGEMLGLDRNQLGKWGLASPGTQEFLKAPRRRLREPGQQHRFRRKFCDRIVGGLWHWKGRRGGIQ
jgi:hypothetical protein